MTADGDAATTESSRTTRAQELLLVLAAGGLVVATSTFVQVGPATGFETSLTSQFPDAFWAAFYGVLVASILVLALSTVDRSGYWRHATALVLADYALFFFLPLARGYRLYGRGASDILVHVGDVKGILATGTLSAGSWYPMQHTLVAELVLAGFPLQGAEYVVAYAFTAVYVVSMGYLVRTMTEGTAAGRSTRGRPATDRRDGTGGTGSGTGRRETAAYGLAAATPLVFSIFHTTIVPSFLSLLLFPVLLAIIEVYRRSDSPTYLALFVVFGIGIVFFHPITAGFVVVLILSTTAFGSLYGRITGDPVRTVRPTLALVVAPAAYVWYINFRETRSSIEQIAEAWLSGGSSPGEAIVDSAASVPLSTADLLARFVELYGMVFVFLVVAGLFGLVVCREALRRDPALRRDRRYAEAYATAQFSVGFAIAVVFFAVYLIEFEPIRVARYLMVMAVFLYALLLVRTETWRPRRRHVALVLFTGGIVAAAVLGANAAYWPNEQMTDAEYEGSTFVLAHAVQDVPVRTYSIPHKMEWYVRGSVHPDLWPPDFETSLEPGFGYDRNHSTLRSRYGHSYLVTHDFDREFHTAAYFSPAQRHQLVVFDRDDVGRLNRDPTVYRIYDNGGFEAWYVPPATNGTTTARLGR